MVPPIQAHAFGNSTTLGRFLQLIEPSFERSNKVHLIASPHHVVSL